MALLHFLREHFSTPEKRLVSLGVLLAFAATIISLIPILFPTAPGLPQLFIVYNACVILALGIVIAVIAFKLAHRGFAIKEQDHTIKERDQEIASLQEQCTTQLTRFQQQLSWQFSNYHAIVHNYRDTISKHFMSAVPQVDWGTVFNVSNELTNNDLELVKEICRHTTSGLIATFKDYFLSRGINIGDDISVAIKILIPPDRVHELFSIDERNKHLLHTTSKLAVTFYRDSNTLRRVHSLREVGTTVYQVDQNTVLFHTIENPGASYYCNNLEKQGNYNNTNESWRRWYNAKLAVPIRTPCMGGGYTCFGVVDIDSLNKEKHDLYNDEECVDIVGHAADLLSIVFLSLARCKYGARRQSDAGANAASA